MDAHQPHAPAPGSAPALGRASALPQTAELRHEREQALVPAPLEAFRQTAQGQQALPPLLPPVARGEHAQDVPAGVHRPQERVHAQVPGQVPHLPQLFQEHGAVPVPGLRRRPDRVVEPAARGAGADLGQMVRREAEDRGPQGRDQGHVPAGIVHHFQQGDHGGGLHRRERVAPLLERTGDPPLRQRGPIGRGPGGGGAQEDHDVLRAAGTPGSVRARHQEAPVQELPDPTRREAGLRLHPSHRRTAVLRPAHGDQMELRPVAVPLLVPVRARMQGLLLPVRHLPHLRGEDRREDQIRRVQHLPPGAEVPGQDHLAGLPRPRLPLRDRPAVLL